MSEQEEFQEQYHICSTRLPLEMYGALLEQAQAHEVSISDEIRTAIEWYLRSGQSHMVGTVNLGKDGMVTLAYSGNLLEADERDYALVMQMIEAFRQQKRSKP